MKDYWGEGSARARNWQRYDMGGDKKLSFEEGVDSHVPYAGSLKDNLGLTLEQGSFHHVQLRLSVHSGFQKKAKITLVSATSIVEGGARCCAQRKPHLRANKHSLLTNCPTGYLCGAILIRNESCMKGEGRYASE